MEDLMNTKKLSMKMYIALSFLILVVMGLVGCDALEVKTVGAKALDANPVKAEAVEIRNDEIEMEPENGSIDPVHTDQIPPASEASPILSDEDAIRAALAAHFGMDESEFYHFEVNENTGMHAKGGVDNGYFLAAKVDGQWIFVGGGHGAPDCVKVARYGFPASMVPWCPTGGSNAPDCPGNGTTVATFIADVTYPDGTIVSPGQSFLKTWRIKNVGTCTWNSEYQLVFESGDAMSGPAHQQLTEIHIPPGETLDISVQLTAPETSGTYRGNWKLRSPHGDIFGTTTGNPIRVEIEVVTSDSEDEENQSSNTGCPTIQITDVNEDQNVTIRGLNFPPNDTFNVLLNYSDTLGIDGKLVTTVKTGASGEFTDTYTIPAFLQGQDTIAIRLESPTSGYYAYNWFYNL
jgi:hypothetical protein